MLAIIRFLKAINKASQNEEIKPLTFQQLQLRAVGIAEQQFQQAWGDIETLNDMVEVTRGYPKIVSQVKLEPATQHLNMLCREHIDFHSANIIELPSAIEKVTHVKTFSADAVESAELALMSLAEASFPKGSSVRYFEKDGSTSKKKSNHIMVTIQDYKVGSPQGKAFSIQVQNAKTSAMITVDPSTLFCEFEVLETPDVTKESELTVCYKGSDKEVLKTTDTDPDAVFKQVERLGFLHFEIYERLADNRAVPFRKETQDTDKVTLRTARATYLMSEEDGVPLLHHLPRRMRTDNSIRQLAAQDGALVLFVRLLLDFKHYVT